MFNTRGPLLVSPAIQASTPQEPPRRRRNKLQKKFPNVQRPTAIDTTTVQNLDPAISVVSQPTSGQTSLRMSPDLSDTKWNAYIPRSRTIQDPPIQPRVTGHASAPTPTIIPEFSHLAVSSSNLRPSLERRFSNIITSSIGTTTRKMRRRAKTPVHMIGDLEAALSGRDDANADKWSNGDLHVQPYSAYTDFKDTRFGSIDTQSDPLPSSQNSLHRSSSKHSQYVDGGEELRPDVYSPTPRRHFNISAESAKSDDGTLVSFDEEAIYFKPLSYSPSPPPPPSPPPRNRARVQRDAEDVPDPNSNLSLKICTDLLAEELSAAMRERSQRMETDISTLQIWVMIEAYERLRCQLLERELHDEETKSLELMFNTWLGALHSLRDNLTSDAASIGSYYDVSGSADEDLSHDSKNVGRRYFEDSRP